MVLERHPKAWVAAEGQESNQLKIILTEEQRNPQPFNVLLCRLDIKSPVFYPLFEFCPIIALWPTSGSRKEVWKEHRQEASLSMDLLGVAKKRHKPNRFKARHLSRSGHPGPFRGLPHDAPSWKRGAEIQPIEYSTDALLPPNEKILEFFSGP